MAENGRNSTKKPGDCTQLLVFLDSCQFYREPNAAGHRIRSMKYCSHVSLTSRAFPSNIGHISRFGEIIELNNTNYGEKEHEYLENNNDSVIV